MHTYITTTSLFYYILLLLLPRTKLDLLLIEQQEGICSGNSEQELVSRHSLQIVPHPVPEAVHHHPVVARAPGVTVRGEGRAVVGRVGVGVGGGLPAHEGGRGHERVQRRSPEAGQQVVAAVLPEIAVDHARAAVASVSTALPR